MKTIIISPYSQKLRNGKKNPKNYPHWNTLVRLLNKDFHTIQIGRSGESVLKNVSEVKFDLKLKEIEELVKSCYTWISVDSFLPHLVNSMENKKTGIVLWSQSDPNIFGYDYNINILKSRLYLRPFQFDIWENAKTEPLSYFSPEQVYGIIKKNLIM
jgi:hypothetical protein